MSKKSLTILGIIFVALLAVFMLQRYVGRTSARPESLSELKFEFDPQAVNTIQVFKRDYPDSGLVFVRRDTGWVIVNEYNTWAKSEEVKKLLDDLAAVSGSIRGESEDLYRDFEIDDRSALQIKFLGTDNSELLHLFVGKGGPDGKSCFLRLPDSPTVYLANNNFISRFAAWAAPPEKKLPSDRWMNLRLSPIKSQDITAFKIHLPNANYEFAQFADEPVDSLTPPASVWKQTMPAKGTILDESKIKGLQSSIANLTAQGVAGPDNAVKFGLDKPAHSIWVSDTLGYSALINFSNKIDTLEQRYVVVQGKDTVFRVNKSAFERIFVTPFEKPKALANK
jgi:hypothetical protein